jgi:hypothetical protein
MHYCVDIRAHLSPRLLNSSKKLEYILQLLFSCLVVSLEQSGILLEHIVKERNGGNVDDFVKLVRENQTILRDMKVC